MTTNEEVVVAEKTKNSVPKKRSSQRREQLTRQAREVFQNRDWLHIPDDTKKRFLDDGYVLRWLRIAVKGEDDHQNIGMRQREGWDLVQSEEAPEMAEGFRVLERGKFAGCIVRGDVALGKQPIEYAEVRNEFVRQQTDELAQAVGKRLSAENNDPRAPITDSSQSRVRTGKSAHFDA